MTNDPSQPVSLIEAQGQLIRQSQLDRMLCFTLNPGGLDFAIRAKHIRGFQRHPENKIKVLIVTDLMGPQGPVGYEINEGFDWCIEMYTAALEGRPTSVLMDPKTRFIGGKASPIIKS